MNKFKRLILLLSILLASVVLFQGIPVLKQLSNLNSISPGLSKGEIHELLGKPSWEWAKSGNTDWWSTNFLFGGLAVQIDYYGKTCTYENKDISKRDCLVKDVRSQFMMIWGNHDILFFKIR